MKIFLASVIILSSLSASASELSNRHLKLIKKSVEEKCDLRASLQLESVKVVEDRIDQGVIDYYFTSQFMATVAIDQGVFDYYKVTVESAEYSAYDHQAQDWGILEVKSVKCEMI